MTDPTEIQINEEIGPTSKQSERKTREKKKRKTEKKKKVVDKGEWVTYNEKARRRGGAVVVSI